jgi:hypothetical protein
MEIESHFGSFGDSLVLVQDRCSGLANVPLAKKLFRMHPMELLDDKAQVEARFGPFGDSANLDGRYVHGLRQTYHWLRNHFGCTRWYFEVMRLK